MSDPTDTATDDEGQAAATTSGIIFGNVTDTSGNALEGVTVTIIDASSGVVVAETETDANGDYSVSVPDDTYDVRAEQPGFEPDEETGVTVSGSNEEVNFTLSRRTYKVRGELEDPYGHGVIGRNVTASGSPRGVTGVVPNAGGSGVLGRATSTTGAPTGVKGTTTADGTGLRSPAPSGVAGIATDATTGIVNGVYGRGSSRETSAVVGDATKAGDYYGGFASTGVEGKTDRSSEDDVVWGTGVKGSATADTGLCYGVRGFTLSDDGYAVYSDGKFKAQAEVAESGGGNLDRHVAQVRNTESNFTSAKPDILGLEFSNITDPTQYNSYISFMDETGTIGNIQGDGNGDVEFTGTTADVAEFFPKRDPEQEFEDGEVVGLVEGEAVSLTVDADPDAVLVVSTAPLVTGNRPPGERDQQDDYVKLSLVGQVPVQVSGAVAHGDVLVAAPEDGGTARARQYADGDDNPIVGMALDEGTDGQIRTLVGGPTPAATTGQPSLTAVREELTAKDDRIEELERENERLRDRLAAVERKLGLAADRRGVADD